MNLIYRLSLSIFVGIIFVVAQDAAEALVDLVVPHQTRYILGRIDSEHWLDFIKERDSKKTTLMQHIQNLSTKEKEDDTNTLLKKSQAIKYFIATGGKNGFRKTPATKAEREILTKALMFSVATFLIDPETFAPSLAKAKDSLIDERRKHGLNTETLSERKHIMEAQRIMAVTLALYHLPYIPPVHEKAFFTRKFEVHVQRMFGAHKISLPLKVILQREALNFSLLFNAKFNKETNYFFDMVGETYTKLNPMIGLKKPISPESESDLQKEILVGCNQYLDSAFGIYEDEIHPEIQELETKIKLSNGLIIERDVNRKSVFRSKNPNQSFTIGGCINAKLFVNTNIVKLNDLTLNPSQTKQDFIEAIKFYADYHNLIFSLIN